MQHELATLTDAELDLVSAGVFSALAQAAADAFAYGDDALTDTLTQTYALVDEDNELAQSNSFSGSYAQAG
jgi:hypothetical protein